MAKPRNKKHTQTHKIIRHAKLATVPHKHNQYRPHLTRWRGIAALLIAVACAQWAYAGLQASSVLGSMTDISSQQLLAKTNVARHKAGVDSLVIDKKLSAAAQAKAADMFEHDYWAHTSPSGVEPWYWVDSSGYSYSVAGENLAKNFTTAGGVVAAWMNSAEHRKNMLEPRYRDVGFAVAEGSLAGKPTKLVVAIYGLSGQGTDLPATLFSSTDGSLNMIARLGIGLQQLNPTLLASILLLLAAAIVGIVAHSQRKKLPKQWRTSWRRHHGLYSSITVAIVMVVMISVYGGGQI